MQSLKCHKDQSLEITTKTSYKNKVKDKDPEQMIIDYKYDIALILKDARKQLDSESCMRFIEEIKDLLTYYEN